MHIKSLLQVFNFLLLIHFVFYDFSSQAQTPEDTSQSFISRNDSIKQDSVLMLKSSKNALDSKVAYEAVDSMSFDVTGKRMLLYGKGDVKYKDIKLLSGFIELEMDKKTVFAEGILDSSGKKVDDPVFSENAKDFSSKTLTYNFETKQGRITKVITKEGEGYIHGETVKKDSTDIFYIRNGLYTTCSNPNPHFYIATKKLKVIPDDKIITGPANLIIEKIPTPLLLPFGFFPNKKGQTSGILIPMYGESPRLGFFLSDGGYYFALSEKADLSLRGDVYSNGSFGIKSTSNYIKRYRYNGVADFKYSRIKTGEKEFPDYFASNDFFVKWTHNQDPKARPDRRFSANVNAGTSNYNKYNAVTSYDNFLTNTFQSNIAYFKTFTGTPFNLALNTAHSQNTLNKTIDITAPELTFTTNRLYPFQKKESAGEKKWYEQISISHSTNYRSFISSSDSALFDSDSLSSTRSKIRSGANHVLPITTSLKVLKYFNITPEFRVTDRMYFKRIDRKFDDDTRKILLDTTEGFYNLYDYRFSTNLSTKLYGMLQFRRGPLKAIRHVFMPNISYSYRPDFSQPKYNYYQEIKIDTSGKTGLFSRYSHGIYGSPESGRSNLVSMNIGNNIEMKVKGRDSLETIKKINLFDQLSLNGSYNLAADSFNLSNISLSLVTTLFKKININGNLDFDPYAVDTNNRRYNKFELDTNERLFRLNRYNLAVGFNFNSKSIPRKQAANTATEEELTMIRNNPQDYVDFSVPWNLGVNYVLTYGYIHPILLLKNPTSRRYTQTFNFYGDLNLTPKWKIGFTSGYDFIQNDFTYTSVDIYRDLHCWEARFRWIPFGFAQSYSLDINVKASVLQDLKLSRKRSWYDN